MVVTNRNLKNSLFFRYVLRVSTWLSSQCGVGHFSEWKTRACVLCVFEQCLSNVEGEQERVKSYDGKNRTGQEEGYRAWYGGSYVIPAIPLSPKDKAALLGLMQTR
jgi:hypothetical protein